MKSAKEVMLVDITNGVYQNVKNIIASFTEAKETDSELSIIIDNDYIFNINIEIQKDELLKNFIKTCYSKDEKTMTVLEFEQELQEIISESRVVCCEHKSLQKIEDAKCYELANIVRPKINTIEIGTRVKVEIFKPQTFIVAEVKRMSIEQLFYSASVHYIFDVMGDDDMLIHALNERPPIFDECYRTSSVDRVNKSLKFMASNFENHVDIDAYIRTFKRSCVMNLETEESNVFHDEVKLIMTNEAIEDRNRYETMISKNFHEELLPLAWHPSRHQEWCLASDEIESLSSQWKI